MGFRPLRLTTLALGTALLLAACSDAEPSPPTDEVAEVGAQDSARDASSPAADGSDAGDRIVYGVGMSGGEWGVYSSADGVAWESVGSFPSGFEPGVLAPGATEDIAVYSLGDRVVTAESGWTDLGESAYSYNNKDWAVTPRAYASGSWWIGAVGVWSSDDGVTWKHVRDKFEDLNAFRDGRAAEGALPLGTIYGNGNLMLVPQSVERSTSSIVRPDDSWEQMTAPVWTSEDGVQWTRRDVEISGEPPVDDASDLETDHYTWDGSRWLWQANDALYAADDTGGTLVFEYVSDIGADGETGRTPIAAAGDLLIAPATDAEPESDENGFAVGGTVLVSGDGGATWTLEEIDVFLMSVEAIADGD